jgi:hypothetical protein
MALYKHAASKDELLDGMIDVVVGEIDPPPSGTDWKTATPQRVLSARGVLLGHPWAPRVIESGPARRRRCSSTGLDDRDLPGRGFSIDLTHHAMHAMGSRLLGFTQELFEETADVSPETGAEMLRAMAGRYPHITELVLAITHDQASVVGQGCDDQFEFELALDLMLAGLGRLRDGTGP